MPRLLIRLLNFFLIALLLTAIWGGWYVSHRGFGKKWRGKIAEEFAKRGVFLSARRVTLDPLRGLIAQDVKIYRDARLDREVARIDQLNLDISYTRLLQKSSFLNGLTLQDADVRLPVDPARPKGRAIHIENLQAKIYFPPGRLEIRRLEGDVDGLHFALSGTLLHPDQYSPAKKEGSSSRNASASAKISSQKNLLYEELAKVAITGGQPRLTMHFSGDLAHPESLRVDEVRFEAQELRWKDLGARQILLQGKYADGRATVENLSWQDDFGQTQMSGWRENNGDFSLQLRAGTDWWRVAHTVFPTFHWPDLTIGKQAELQTEVSYLHARAPVALQVLGSLQTGPWSLNGVDFETFQAGFSYDGSRWSVRNLRIDRAGGDFQADLLGGPDGFQARVLSNLDPVPLLPLLTVWTETKTDVLQSLHFRSPPYLDLKISGPGTDPATWLTTGNLALGYTSFRGYTLNSARGDLTIQNGRMDFKNVQVVRDEGVGTGAFSWDARTQKVQLDGVHSTLDPVAVCTWILPTLGQLVAPYRFHQSPEVSAEGSVQLKSPTGTALTIKVSAPTGMDYTFLSKDLPFDRVQGQLFFKDRRLAITEMQGMLFGGEVRGMVDVSLLPGSQDYQTTIELGDVDFPKISSLYLDYRGSSGKLSGSGQFGGVGVDASKLTGKGRASVHNGEVFTIPVFGPLSKTLDKFLPGFGYNQAHQAGGSFSIKDGVLQTSDFEIVGKGVNMYGAGEIGFLDKKMDFDMRVNATGLPGAVLDPVSKLLEFHSNGPLPGPVWKPKNFPASTPAPPPTP